MAYPATVHGTAADLSSAAWRMQDGAEEAVTRSLRATAPVPQTAQKLVITSGKDQGKRPSAATVYRILAGDADSTA